MLKESCNKEYTTTLCCTCSNIYNLCSELDTAVQKIEGIQGGELLGDVQSSKLASITQNRITISHKTGIYFIDNV